MKDSHQEELTDIYKKPESEYEEVDSKEDFLQDLIDDGERKDHSSLKLIAYLVACGCLFVLGYNIGGVLVMIMVFMAAYGLRPLFFEGSSKSKK